MALHQTLRKALLGLDVALAYSIVVALYLLKFVAFQPLQIPAYLLIVAYDVVELGLPILTPYHPIGFPVFLYLLAIIGAAATRLGRPDDGKESSVTRTAGGVSLVIGLLSLLFAVVVGGPVISPTDNPTPLVITTATGIVFLVTAWWLLRQQSSQSPTTV